LGAPSRGQDYRVSGYDYPYGYPGTVVEKVRGCLADLKTVLFLGFLALVGAAILVFLILRH
jgi:hypothetical protein